MVTWGVSVPWVADGLLEHAVSLLTSELVKLKYIPIFLLWHLKLVISFFDKAALGIAFPVEQCFQMGQEGDPFLLERDARLHFLELPGWKW